MTASDGAASTVSSKVRRLHAHDFPAVDLAVTPFPETESAADARAAAAGRRSSSRRSASTTCTRRMELTLENVTAGHSWPSGATPDRRAWIELTAYAGGAVIYSSGGAAAFPLEGSTDPDLWLMRDCLFDGAGQETKLFWEAASATGNAVPGSVIQNVNDPTTFNRRTRRSSTRPTGMLPMMPDRVSLKFTCRRSATTCSPIWSPRRISTRRSRPGSRAISWAARRRSTGRRRPRRWSTTGPPAPLLCVVKPIMYRDNTAPAVSNAHCAPPP